MCVCVRVGSHSGATNSIKHIHAVRVSGAMVCGLVIKDITTQRRKPRRVRPDWPYANERAHGALLSDATSPGYADEPKSVAQFLLCDSETVNDSVTETAHIAFIIEHCEHSSDHIWRSPPLPIVVAIIDTNRSMLLDVGARYLCGSNAIAQISQGF